MTGFVFAKGQGWPSLHVGASSKFSCRKQCEQMSKAISDGVITGHLWMDLYSISRLRQMPKMQSKLSLQFLCLRNFHYSWYDFKSKYKYNDECNCNKKYKGYNQKSKKQIQNEDGGVEVMGGEERLRASRESDFSSILNYSAPIFSSSRLRQ